jgi:hypothetical protein
MQKRSHWLLASTLLRRYQGFPRKQYEWAFLLGSCQPDCNPLSYLKGSLRGRFLRGHDFSNSRSYLNSRIRRLRERTRWTLWHYYTLGKLTHYLADAFTFPHNETYEDSLTAHRRYEAQLRHQLAEHIGLRRANFTPRCRDLSTALTELHRQYLSAASHLQRDMEYILDSTFLLVSTLLPSAAAGNR